MLVLPGDPSTQGQPGLAALLSCPAPLNSPGARYHTLCVVALASTGIDGANLVDLFNARADVLLQLKAVAHRVLSDLLLPAPTSPLDSSLQARSERDAFDGCDPAVRCGPSCRASVLQ